MVSEKATVKNQTGLHARPANDFVSLIQSFENCTVEIENEKGKRVKAVSLIKVLSLGLTKDAEVTIYCDGEEESEVLSKIVTFINELKD